MANNNKPNNNKKSDAFLILLLGVCSLLWVLRKDIVMLFTG